MSVSVREIAEQLGVSAATVSRALNGDPHVLPETRRAVLEAAGTDRPRQRRSSAETRGSGTFLVIAGKLSNPIIIRFIDGLRDILRAQGFRTVITLTDFSVETECDALDFADRSGFSGVFLLNVIETPALLTKLRTLRRPVVLINKYLHGADADAVQIDNYRCGYLAGEYLAKRGHTRIGHLSGPATSATCEDRTRGFSDALREYGLDALRWQKRGDRTAEAGRRYAEYCLSLPAPQRPTAMFCMSGRMAAGVAETLQRGGIGVPSGFAIVVSDDYSQDYMPYRGDFSCFGQDPLNMARNASDLMFRRLSSPGSDHCRMLLPPVFTDLGSV